MTKEKPLDAMAKIVEILGSLPAEERGRVLQAAMVLVGEVPSKVFSTGPNELNGRSEEFGQFPPRARSWMKQYGVTADELQQVFQLTDGGAEVIAVPGNNKKAQTYNAYILTGIGRLLAGGVPSFEDKAARALCESSGCYDRANHSSHLKNRGNEFTGTKQKGWTLTAPGLKRAAEIIKDFNKPNP